jgi:hypothetical protein
MTHLDRASAYLRAIEAGGPGTDAFFAPDVVQREFPNRLSPNGVTRDLARRWNGPRPPFVHPENGLAAPRAYPLSDVNEADLLMLGTKIAGR